MKHLRVDKYGWVNICLVRRLGDLGISALNCASRGLGLSSDWDIVLPRQDCSLNPTNQEFRLVAMDFQAHMMKNYGRGAGEYTVMSCSIYEYISSISFPHNSTAMIWMRKTIALRNQSMSGIGYPRFRRAFLCFWSTLKAF